MKFTDLGTLQMGTYPPVYLDRIAVDERDRLLFASILGDAGLIKGIRALLHSETESRAVVSGIKVKQASGDSWSDRTLHVLAKKDGGYSIEYVRFGFGQTHAFIRSKSPHFLMAEGPEFAWATLNDGNRFTTPILPEWTAWIVEQLKAGSYLVEADCYRCSCALLNCSDAALDAVVSRGVRERKLIIPGS